MSLDWETERWLKKNADDVKGLITNNVVSSFTISVITNASGYTISRIFKGGVFCSHFLTSQDVTLSISTVHNQFAVLVSVTKLRCRIHDKAAHLVVTLFIMFRRFWWGDLCSCWPKVAPRCIHRRNSRLEVRRPTVCRRHQVRVSVRQRRTGRHVVWDAVCSCRRTTDAVSADCWTSAAAAVRGSRTTWHNRWATRSCCRPVGRRCRSEILHSRARPLQ